MLFPFKKSNLCIWIQGKKFNSAFTFDLYFCFSRTLSKRRKSLCITLLNESGFQSHSIFLFKALNIFNSCTLLSLNFATASFKLLHHVQAKRKNSFPFLFWRLAFPVSKTLKTNKKHISNM